MKTLIKNCKLLLALVLITSFLSCSSDDDTPAPPQEPTTAELLTHKWFLVKRVDISTTPPTTHTADSCEQNTYFNFYDDGTIVAENFGLNGTNCESLSFEAGTYVLNDDENQITITETSSTSSVDIVTLTKTELVINLSGTLEIHFSR